jgi:tetratricopeptide (TPR) repeat protein
MKIFLCLGILFLTSCSSGQKKSNEESTDLTNKSFQKNQPILQKDFQDYLPATVKSINPALSEETMERFSIDEIRKSKQNMDNLVEISFLCRQGNYVQAENLISSSFNTYHKLPVFWNVIGNCHLKKGNLRRALLFYNKALEISPSYVPALNNIGVIYLKQGGDQKALVAFEKANVASKFSKTPRYNLSRLYLIYGLAEQARPLIESLLNDSPSDNDLLNMAATSYLILGDYKNSLSIFNKIPRNKFSNPEIGLNYTLALLKNGDSKLAAQQFKSVAVPTQSEFKNYYSSIKAEIGDLK